MKTSLSADKKRTIEDGEARLRAALEAFARIPATEWTAARRLLRPLQLARGDCLTRIGEPAVEFAWVMRGLMRKYYVDRAGNEVIRGFSVESTLAGAFASLLTGSPSGLQVEALEPTQLLVVRYSDFTRLYERHGCWQVIGRKVAEGLFLERERREQQLLTLTAPERYAAFLVDFPGLVARLPQHQIAAYLGITPVSLSRIRGRLLRR